MASVPFTDAWIRRLKPTPGRQLEVFDKTPGLGVRISSGGAKAFFVSYKLGGRNRCLGLGRYPTVTLKQARQMARDALSQVARGLDPATEKIRARESYDKKLFPSLLDDFIEKHAKRKTRSSHETERILRREFAHVWRKLTIDQITKRTINDVLDGIVKRGAPSAANHAFAAIRRFFNCCVERGYLEHSPCAGMKIPCRVISRDRVLSDHELAAIWAAADKMGYPFGRLVQLLILTAQRRSEVGGMRWQEIDLSKGLWELPPGTPERTHKSERRHIVPLSPQAVALLKSLPRVHDQLVFPGRGKGTPACGYSKWKRRLDQLSGVRDWGLHDLRRTAATGMASLDVSPHVIERVLNHKSGMLGGVAAVYNRFAYLPEMAEALTRWSQHLALLVQAARDAADAKSTGLPPALKLAMVGNAASASMAAGKAENHADNLTLRLPPDETYAELWPDINRRIGKD